MGILNLFNILNTSYSGICDIEEFLIQKIQLEYREILKDKMIHWALTENTESPFSFSRNIRKLKPQWMNVKIYREVFRSY